MKLTRTHDTHTTRHNTYVRFFNTETTYIQGLFIFSLLPGVERKRERERTMRVEKTICPQSAIGRSHISHINRATESRRYFTHKIQFTYAQTHIHIHIHMRTHLARICESVRILST